MKLALFAFMAENRSKYPHLFGMTRGEVLSN